MPVHSVRRIDFAGQTVLDEGDLRRAVSDRFGVAQAATRAAEVVEFLRAYYRDRGFPDAAVTSRTSLEHAPERTVLVFDITAGTRLTLGTITVEGNAPGSLDAARQALRITAGEAYDKESVDRRVASYVTDLRKRGYYEAQGEHALRLSADRRTAELIVTLDGGPHVSVEFQGDPLPPKVREELVPIEREGSVDEDLLEDSARRIADHLRGEGYRDANVTYSRAPRNGELAIIFKVTRGPAYVAGPVEISGNASIPVADLAGAIRVREGQPFLESALDATVAAVTDAYHRRGFLDVKLRSGVETEPGAVPVVARSRLVVVEGARTLIGAVTVSGNTAIPADALTASILAKPGQPFYQPQLGDRSRLDAAAVPEPGLPHGRRDREGGDLDRPDARRRRLRGERGPAGLRRPHPGRRQREDQRGDDQARGAAEARRSARLRGTRREPAAGQRARVVPPRADHRDRSRRRGPAGPAGRRSKRPRPPPSGTAAASRWRGGSCVPPPRVHRTSGSSSRRAGSSRSAGATCSATTGR